jgi:hypothetical protein
MNLSMTAKNSHNVQLMEGIDNDSSSEGLDETESNDPYAMRRMAFPRTFTDPLANAIDYIAEGDGKVAKTIVENLQKFDEHGQDGDIPEQPAFAADVVFWKIVGLGCLLGGAMGLLGLAFMNVIDEVSLLISNYLYNSKCADWSTNRHLRSGSIQMNLKIQKMENTMKERYLIIYPLSILCSLYHSLLSLPRHIGLL